MDRRRTNPFFLSDGEALREKLRTQYFVRSLAKNQRPICLKGRLCDSCGISIFRKVWFCKVCNTCFCDKCGHDFGQISKRVFPVCPICEGKLDYERGAVPDDYRKKIFRYLQSTNANFKNEEEFILKSSILFNQDISYIRQVWQIIKKEKHAELRLLEHKFEEKQASIQGNNKITTLKPRAHVYVAHYSPRPSKEDKKVEVSPRDVKPLNGLEIEWKEGKLNPVEPKKYRNSFQDKD